MAHFEHILDRIHKIDAAHGQSPSRRRFHMEKVRDDFFQEVIAQRLQKLQRWEGAGESELRSEAGQIIKKAGRRAFPNKSDVRRRTPEEERFVIAARVAWHKLLKTEGVPSARPRSSDAPLRALTGTASKLRRLSNLRLRAQEGSIALREYIASYTLHLADICKQAKAINPDFVSGDIEEALAKLHAIVSCDATGGADI